MYTPHVWEESIYTALLNRVQSEAVRLMNSFPFNVITFSFSQYSEMLHLLLSSTVSIMVISLPHLQPRCTKFPTFLPGLSTLLIQELGTGWLRDRVLGSLFGERVSSLSSPQQSSMVSAIQLQGFRNPNSIQELTRIFTPSSLKTREHSTLFSFTNLL